VRTRENAVLVPFHLVSFRGASSRILVQDRRGHKPPPWSFFGGGIEVGETPLGAVLREVREELSFALPPNELTGLDTVTGVYADVKLALHTFLWPFDGDLGKFH